MNIELLKQLEAEGLQLKNEKKELHTGSNLCGTEPFLQVP